MRIIGFIACIFTCGVLSSPAIAAMWELETTTLPPKSEYPEGVDATDFEGVLNAYNAYINAFAAEDHGEQPNRLIPKLSHSSEGYATLVGMGRQFVR